MDRVGPCQKHMVPLSLHRNPVSTVVYILVANYVYVGGLGEPVYFRGKFVPEAVSGIWFEAVMWGICGTNCVSGSCVDMYGSNPTRDRSERRNEWE